MHSNQGNEKFVGIQISPISFIDEGVEAVLETLQEQVGINVLLIGTVSWLGLKSGRSISHELDGFPDHGIPEPFAMKGGAYFKPNPNFYSQTLIKDFRATDSELQDKDILEMVIPAARARGMKVFVELMEPFFKYEGHGSVNTVNIPNLPQLLEVDVFGRIGSDPSTSNPDYRNWIHSMVEDQCRNYDIDGVMWCNERRSPLDQMMVGQAPTDFSQASRNEAMQRGIDVERVCLAYKDVFQYFQKARAGEQFVDGSFIEFLRVLLTNPEILIWEKFWLERNKDLDRELYGIVKWCNADLSFGLNVWNRNHFNPLRKAQWPWQEQTLYADWVKPITYQHQAGQIYVSEITVFHQSILRDFTPEELTPLMYKLLNLNEASWSDVVQTGMDPDTYIFGQCQDAVRGVNGKASVYMGIGVDAPRIRKDQAVCTPDIVRRSVLASYRAGANGVVFAPNYASMKLSNLAGAAQAFKELGLW